MMPTSSTRSYERCLAQLRLMALPDDAQANTFARCDA